MIDRKLNPYAFLHSRTMMYFTLLVLSFSYVAANCMAKCRCQSNEMDCSYTSITHLPQLSRNLKTLNASHNRIAILNRNTFYKPVKTDHETDDYNNNGTRSISQSAVLGQSQLKMIDLSWNSIVFIHLEVFAFTPKLTWLSLANNAALQLPENGFLLIVKSLKILNLSYCNISNVGVHAFRTGKHNLEELYLQHNIISTVHKNAFISFENLQVLDLSYNRLVSLAVSVLIPLKQMNDLKLQNNPWLCDCSIKDVYRWSVYWGVHLRNVTCSMLQEFGLPWSIQINNMNCVKIRIRRNANGEPRSDSGSEEYSSGWPLALIIIGILMAVLVIVVLCACMLNNSHDCMEAVGCLLICQHCYQ